MMEPRTSNRLFLAAALAVCCGCHGHAPIDFGTYRDSAYYAKLAAEVQTTVSEEIEVEPFAARPATLQNFDQQRLWDLSLEEAVHVALDHNRIIRQLSRVGFPTQGGAVVAQAAETVLGSPDLLTSSYDPAIQASNVVGAVGVAAALSAFDTGFSMSTFWEKNEQPINVNPPSTVIFARDFAQDRANFQAELTKITTTGAEITLGQTVLYDLNNNPTRVVPSDYNVNYQIRITQPFLRGAGTSFNQIAGPGALPGVYNGVLIARINGDISLLDFEIAVRDLVGQVETVYWELYLAYRALDAARTGRDSSLENWRKTEANARVGREYAVREAQALSEYYRFTSRMQAALCELLDVENRLRYLMGLGASDGRVIRPCEDPTVANVVFDWELINLEAIVRSPELRRLKWRVKQRELELTAARHFLMPRLDGVAQYRWVGAGDHLTGNRGVPPFTGSDAYSTLIDGKYQEWHLEIQFSMPLGFRQGRAAVRNAELRLARERARLQVGEQELMHLLAEAVRDVECNYVLARTRYNTWQAAQREAHTAKVAHQVKPNVIPFTDVRNAVSRRADAETEYFRAVVNYRRAIIEVHLRKGSLLEFNQIYLAEAPWPGHSLALANKRRGRVAGEAELDFALPDPAAVVQAKLPAENSDIAVAEESAAATASRSLLPWE